MKQQVMKVISIGSTLMLSLAILVGLPVKAPATLVKVDPECVDIGPFKWSSNMVKAYTKGYIRMHYPEWNHTEWKALHKLWNAESRWNHQAKNPTSTAYGVAQVLDTPIGLPAPQQVARGLAYIKHRYERPSAAWAFHRSNYYY
jgi:hypothetical protein